MKIYTRTGDDGDTALLGGGRVGKDDARVAAYGEVDELNAVIGWALAVDPRDLQQDLLTSIQRDLFAIGGQLASPDRAKVSKVLAKAQLDDARIAALEAAIDAADTSLKPLEAFILPGGSPKAAALHMARNSGSVGGQGESMRRQRSIARSRSSGRMSRRPMSHVPSSISP